MTLAYTSYLLRTATLGDYHEALRAIPPCYWIYAEAGEALIEQGSTNPLYQRRILIRDRRITCFTPTRHAASGNA